MTNDTHPRHFLEGKTIVIAGAGVSGLAFSIALHKLWPSVSSSPPPKTILYERDPCAVPPNREGYSLSLRSDYPSAGIQTLKKMGVLDTLLEVAIVALGADKGKSDGEKEAGKGGGFVIWDKDYKPVMKVRSKTPPDCPVSGMRIARGNLRRLLVTAVEDLPNTEIRWADSITGVSSSPSLDGTKRVEVETSKSGPVTCDLLIAADGSSSKLRGILRPSDRLKFAGPTYIHGTTSLKHSPGESKEEFGTVISGLGPALFIAPVDGESMVWVLSWNVESPPPPRKQPMPLSASEELLAKAREMGEKVYGERFVKMLEATDIKSVNKVNAMDKQAFPHTAGYIHNAELAGLEGRVVFLGDANHAVSPFAGNGANLALMDGWDFAESLLVVGGDADGSGCLEKAIKRYDALAVGRAKKVVGISHFSIRVMHSTGWWLVVWMVVLRIIRFLFFK